MDQSSSISAPIEVDEEKAKRLVKWVVSEEAENNKTNKRDDGEMILRIVKRIKEEVKC